MFLSVKYDSVKALPRGARVGTSSLRRQAQLKVARPDLVFIRCVGMLTRACASWKQGEYDAIILAAAGLTRLGKTQHVKEVSVGRVHVSGGGAGRLGIEIREGDVAMRKHLAFLERFCGHAAATCASARCSTSWAADARFRSAHSRRCGWQSCT